VYREFKRLGLTSAKSEYVMEFQIPTSSLEPLAGGRGAFIFEAPAGLEVDRSAVSFFGRVADWAAQ
jgi:hypothetical protein